ncbi:RagB/SusD family nutrient uptake outer membrane protein [Pedobacter hiemivivus]|uniref:RagB/SusD family nutrient uptake outer membrane protein n=1 Tax=Pedobacter hiemivivus TaxID=2530454 RepID=A0A4U1GIG0_9SPHI|nr:RagB/SusD family nutrient uptake outer membrane protein [Pedobacter hiemivivus]TKC64067.1 RagB/SusD family nutrient uptake outer membrane protein [Pedobacter hiemivivus]
MKTTFNVYITMTGLLLAAVSFTSCQKLIEIPNPPSAITQEVQFADSLTTLSAVTGVYALNNGNGFAYSNVAFTALPALSADELTYVPVNDYQQFYNYSLTPVNSGATTLWGNIYQSIYQVNAVLGGITNNNSLSASFQKQITGEMEVVRALYYFSLVNFFGDVPLITTTDYNTTSRLPRSPVAAVYSQIMTDLADARKKLTATYPSAGRARPNLYTAIALQAKVNLYQGNWQSAYNEADSVIRLGGYSLVLDGLTKVFLKGSTEAIWQIPGAQAFSNGVPDAVAFVPGSVNSFPNYIITPFLLGAFEATDQRLVNWTGSKVRLVNGVNQTQYYPYKYKNRLSTVAPAEDQMVLRLAEMYLIRAEAAAHLGGAINLGKALVDVNTIRLRAGLLGSTADVTSQTAVLNAIMQERRTELFCEWANRWYDLKRTGTAAAVLGAVKTGYIPDAALYPVPQAQRDLNNQLSQNLGYN